MIGTYKVGDGPIGLLILQTNVWVTNERAGTVTELSSSGEVLGTFKVESRPLGITTDGDQHLGNEQQEQHCDQAVG